MTALLDSLEDLQNALFLSQLRFANNIAMKISRTAASPK
jgi:hypothetical protein